MNVRFLLVILLASQAHQAMCAPPIAFEDQTAAVGLLEPLKGIMGHGMAWGDINNDGYPDLFVGGFTNRQVEVYNQRGHTGGPRPDQIFVNDRGRSFKPLQGVFNVLANNSGAAFADFDNDGDLDLVVSHVKLASKRVAQRGADCVQRSITGNRIYRNDGNGSFSDVTAKSNLDFPMPFLGRNTFILDYDGDGLLDILIQEDAYILYQYGYNSRLMRNLGDFVFSDTTKAAGIPTAYRKGIYGFGGAVGDVNGDTWPDLYMAHCDVLLINNRDGTFRMKKNLFFPLQESLDNEQSKSPRVLEPTSAISTTMGTWT